jgi:hypothetical protein
MNAPMKILRKALAVAFLTLTAVTSNAGQAGQTVEFETIVKQYSSGHGEKKNYVITNRQEWEELWNTIYANSSPRPDAPFVDFTKRMVIAVFQGAQPSSSYNITITKLVKKESALRVYVKERTPSPECMVLWVITQPYHIIEVDRADVSEVHFKVKEKTQNCQ